MFVMNTGILFTFIDFFMIRSPDHLGNKCLHENSLVPSFFSLLCPVVRVFYVYCAIVIPPSLFAAGKAYSIFSFFFAETLKFEATKMAGTS